MVVISAGVFAERRRSGETPIFAFLFGTSATRHRQLRLHLTNDLLKSPVSRGFFFAAHIRSNPKAFRWKILRKKQGEGGTAPVPWKYA
jgi:hypothetical protein